MSSEPKPLSADALRALARLANAVILLAVGLFLAILVLALKRYNPNLGSDQLLTFYIAPAVFIAGLLATFRLRRETRIGLALFMVAVGVTLVGVETALVLMGAAAPTSGPQGGSPIFDRVLALRAEGDPAIPSIAGNALLGYGLTIPIGSGSIRPVTTGPANRTTVLCGEFIDPIVYRSDRYGFNNPDEVWDADTIDVALVGDSYTHGVCVKREHQLASYVRESIPTLNLGVRGVGPFQELAVLREYGGLRTPRHVVWIYYEGNDLWDLLGIESGEDWLHDYLDPSHIQNLAEYQDSIDVGYGAWVDSLVALGPERIGENFGGLGPSLGDLLKSVPRFDALRRLLGFGVLVPHPGGSLAQIPDILERAEADVARWGGEFYVVYLPAFGRFTTRFGEGTPGRTDFVRLMEERGTNFLDLVPVFEATGRPREMWMDPRGHLSPEGYSVAAAAILEMVQANR